MDQIKLEIDVKDTIHDIMDTLSSLKFEITGSYRTVKCFEEVIAAQIKLESLKSR